MKSRAIGVKRGCGIDIDKIWLWACLYNITPKLKIKEKIRQFSNNEPGIEKLKKWLARNQVTHVAFESTGVYWQQLHDNLYGQFKIIVGNPYHMKAIRGYKTDRGDGRWIATLLRVGAIKPSFIPPRQIRELRLLTRQYRNMVQDSTRIMNRISKTLRQAGITLDQCIKNLFSKSGHAMLEGLIAGEDAETVAAKGSRLRVSQEELKDSLENTPISSRYRIVLSRYYRNLTFLEKEIAALWEEIESVAKPFSNWISLLDTIPGIGRISAICIVAEIGVDMSVFPSVKKIASWAGVCSGNNASGGKQKSGRARKGNRYLRGILGEAAWGAIRTKGSSFREFYFSNKDRLGHKNKAAFAVAHKLLRTCYSVLRDEVVYTETCPDELKKRSVRVRKQLRVIATEELVQELEYREKRERFSCQISDSVPLPV